MQTRELLFVCLLSKEKLYDDIEFTFANYKGPHPKILESKMSWEYLDLIKVFTDSSFQGKPIFNSIFMSDNSLSPFDHLWSLFFATDSLLLGTRFQTRSS